VAVTSSTVSRQKSLREQLVRAAVNISQRRQHVTGRKSDAGNLRIEEAVNDISSDAG